MPAASFVNKFKFLVLDNGLCRIEFVEERHVMLTALGPDSKPAQMQVDEVASAVIMSHSNAIELADALSRAFKRR